MNCFCDEYWLHQHKKHSQMKNIIEHPAVIPNTRCRHEGLPSAKIKQRMQTSANIQTRKQKNGCLLHSIPCDYILACGCCGFQACMKWCALNMNEGRRRPNYFCDEYFLHFPWASNPRGVRGSPFFTVTLLLCCCVRCTSSCVCVPSVRDTDTTDRPCCVCKRWSLVCRSCLLLPLPSVCWCCGRAVCVRACCRGLECVVRGVRRTVHAWLLPFPHVVCPLCVSAAPLVSPVSLHVPHCADQLHTTERPHSR
ncbi:hypothetical protein TCDM_09404 [Trypanosoma cruzi Dm28c]|uniref:Mucin TcMUCII n=1 Tax=Trypanosoma cruzi Dm28c TaxID=1416333 RepID=V5AQ49_TRYCR|nr:hypothetical protein TCDM_09404 [Trypanosoma cruzi Dm28c]